jgi:cysteinyl-tRNA synthetase
LGLGFSETQHHHKLTVVSEAELSEEVQKLARAREAARKNKDFETSDALRKELESLGYTVQDSADSQKILKA